MQQAAQEMPVAVLGLCPTVDGVPSEQGLDAVVEVLGDDSGVLAVVHLPMVGHLPDVQRIA